MFNSYTAPIASTVNALQTELASVKCRLPETVTLPANSSIAVPVSGVPFNTLCGWSNFNGFNTGWNTGCCTNTLWG
jgi:hypothetical protein